MPKQILRGRRTTNRVLRQIASSQGLPTGRLVSNVPGTNRLQVRWPLWFDSDEGAEYYPLGWVTLQVATISVWGKPVWGINLLIDSDEPAMSFCWRIRPHDDTVIMVASCAQMTARVRDWVKFCLRPDVQTSHPTLGQLRTRLQAHNRGLAAEL